MSAELFFLPFNPIFGISGLPAGAAQVFFYQTGTTTLAPVYGDSGLSQRLANPVRASALGQLPTLYLDGNIKYRIQVLDALGGAIGPPIDPYIPGTIVPALKGDPGGGPGGSVGPFSALKGIIIPNGTNTFLVDDGGFVVYDNTITNADLAAYPLAMTKDQMGRPFRRDVSAGLSILAMEAKADDSTDALPAFNAGMAYLARLAGTGTGYKGGAKLRVPAGKYFVSDAIQIKLLSLTIEGDGGGMAGGIATQLRFGPDKTGIIVQRYNTTGYNTEALPTNVAGDNSIIRGIALVGAGPTAGTYTDPRLAGIYLRARARIEDVTVNGFQGAGILVRATSGGGGTAEGNANVWRVDQARVINNGSGGLVTQGADANAGTAIGVDASNNIGYGIDDGSFLGNSYIGCHMEANSLGPWIVRDNNAMVDMNAYTEPGQPNAVSSPGTVASGRQFVPITDNGGATIRAAGLAGGGLQCSTGFTAVPYQATGCRVGMGRGAAMLDLTPSGADTYRFVDGGNGSVAVTYANLGSLAPIWFYPDGSALISKPRYPTAAGTTLGTVVKKVQVFNADGTSAGFVPVYDNIT